MKNKKILIALVLLLVVRGASGTVAYFTRSDTTVNVFDSGKIDAYVTENFVSPENWTPGTTTNTSIIATNHDDAIVAVRIKIEETWKDTNNDTLPNEIDNIPVALVNYNTTDWIKNGDYYYYNKPLSKNESTSSLVSSVTYNENILGTTSCSESNDGTKIKCINSNGYEGATYTLTSQVELAQYSEYKTLWNTNIEIR